MAGFFIERPIFAWVIAIVVMLAGALAIPTLPVSQYPEIAPPSVNISASYPGASARTLEDTVTQVIEQNMKALDGLLYLEGLGDATRVHVSWRDGQCSFEARRPAGTDPVPDLGNVSCR